MIIVQAVSHETLNFISVKVDGRNYLLTYLSLIWLWAIKKVDRHIIIVVYDNSWTILV